MWTKRDFCVRFTNPAPKDVERTRAKIRLKKNPETVKDEELKYKNFLTA